MDNHYPHPIIAREGWPFIGVALGLAMMVTGAGGLLWGWPLWVIFAFVLQFFRDPARPVPGDNRSVLSPADGRIVAVEPARDPWLDRDSLKVSVFMNVWPVLKSLPQTGTLRCFASSSRAGISALKFGAPLAYGTFDMMAA